MTKDVLYPVSESFKVLEGFDILRTEKLIVAIVAVKIDRGNDVRLYRWQKRGEGWKVDLCRMSIGKWNFTDIYNIVLEFKQKYQIKDDNFE